MFVSFEKWAEGRIFWPKPSRLYCDDFMITGEMDQLEKVSDFECDLTDFKCSWEESPTWILQGSGYERLLYINGYTVRNINFVKLSK